MEYTELLIRAIKKWGDENLPLPTRVKLVTFLNKQLRQLNSLGGDNNASLGRIPERVKLLSLRLTPLTQKHPTGATDSYSPPVVKQKPDLQKPKKPGALGGGMTNIDKFILQTLWRRAFRLPTPRG
jgi:hypothetical protein